MRRIKQGEIYLVDFGEPIGSEPGYRRPCLIIHKK
jgi:mRNA-degrading endonuclease toxin of MazEF toxin-antitoxin module